MAHVMSEGEVGRVLQQAFGVINVPKPPGFFAHSVAFEKSS